MNFSSIATFSALSAMAVAATVGVQPAMATGQSTIGASSTGTTSHTSKLIGSTRHSTAPNQYGGDPQTPTYCGNYEGCIGIVKGRKVYAPSKVIPFTSQESAWFAQCQKSIAGSAIMIFLPGGGSAKITGKIAVAVITGGILKNEFQSCMSFYNSYSKRR